MDGSAVIVGGELTGPGARADELARQILGAAIEVHKVLGPGFLESVYEQALGHELELRKLSFVRQAPVQVSYKGVSVGEGKIDVLVDGLVIVELKAVEELAPIHTAQVISYLKAKKLRLGLLLNFNSRILKDGIKRIVL